MLSLNKSFSFLKGSFFLIVRFKQNKIKDAHTAKETEAWRMRMKFAANLFQQ